MFFLVLPNPDTITVKTEPGNADDRSNMTYTEIYIDPPGFKMKYLEDSETIVHTAGKDNV